jgi:hypothetical protein
MIKLLFGTSLWVTGLAHTHRPETLDRKDYRHV